jgi:hypothetical protein
MSTWIALTEKHIGLNNAEQVAYREALLRPGESDRLEEIVTAVVGKVRGAIRSNRDNRLDPDGTLIPASAAAYAGALVRYELLANFVGNISEPRTKQWEAAERWLRDVAAGRYLIEPPSEEADVLAPPKAGPRFTKPNLTQRREDAQG